MLQRLWERRPLEQDIQRLTLEKAVLLDHLEALERDLDGSVERLDALTKDLDGINEALKVIDDQLRVSEASV